MPFTGAISALVTPFNDDMQINENEYRKLIRFQMENSISGLVPCGTTGESPTLTADEKIRLIEIAIEEANGEIPVIAGSGNYNTAETIQLTKKVRDLGADAALLVTPYYNKPNQTGLFLHYEAIAKACPDIELVIYNVPSRTNVNIEPKTVQTLFQSYKNIRTIKEASGDLNQITELHRICGEEFCILSGEDGLVLPYMACGAKGVISVASNIIPQLFEDLVTAGLQGDFQKARKLQEKCSPLIQALFAETNPIPAKFALGKMGFDTMNIRLPLHEHDKNLQKNMIHELQNLDLI